MLAEFAAKLPRRPYVSAIKAYPIIRSREHAAAFAYVQPNAPGLISWLVFDIDTPGAPLAWMDGRVPAPNLIVASMPREAGAPLGTAHLYYLLSAPVATTEAARAKPIRYAAAIEAALTQALGADPGYARLLAKNPLHPQWCVRAAADRAYSLGALARGLDLPSSPRGSVASVGLGRNCTLFDRLRTWAYSAKARFTSAEEFRHAVFERATEFNAFPVPLSASEVRATARSVSNWVWTRYTGRGAKEKDRGAVGLRPDMDLSLPERQALGALYTARKRSRTTTDTLRRARFEVVAEGRCETQAEIAERTGLSLRTVKRHWTAINNPS